MQQHNNIIMEVKNVSTILVYTVVNLIIFMEIITIRHCQSFSNEFPKKGKDYEFLKFATNRNNRNSMGLKYFVRN